MKCTNPLAHSMTISGKWIGLLRYPNILVNSYKSIYHLNERSLHNFDVHLHDPTTHVVHITLGKWIGYLIVYLDYFIVYLDWTNLGSYNYQLIYLE